MATAPAWEPVARVPTYELVLARIEEQLIRGTLRPGDRLPAERDLAARLGASRPAVREALRVLQAQGILRAGVGTGAEAGTIVTAAPSGALTRLLRVHLAVSSFPLADVVEARVMLERSSAVLAAGQRTDADLARMDAALEAMDDPDVAPEVFNDLDTEFHVAIAESGGNRLVADLTVAIRESMRPTLQAAMAQADDWLAMRDRLRRDHHGIADAIRAADGARAAELIEEHIRGFYAGMVAADAARDPGRRP